MQISKPCKFQSITFGNGSFWKQAEFDDHHARAVGTNFGHWQADLKPARAHQAVQFSLQEHIMQAVQSCSLSYWPRGLENSWRCRSDFRVWVRRIADIFKFLQARGQPCGRIPHGCPRACKNLNGIVARHPEVDPFAMLGLRQARRWPRGLENSWRCRSDFRVWVRRIADIFKFLQARGQPCGRIPHGCPRACKNLNGIVARHPEVDPFAMLGLRQARRYAFFLVPCWQLA